MKPPKTPIEFDYDLWLTKAGECMVRIKETGEICAVDRTTFRLLRSEEKKLRRSKHGVPIKNQPGQRSGIRSTDDITAESEDDDAEGTWLTDSSCMEDSIVAKMIVEQFLGTLTRYQRDVCEKCLVGKMSFAEYSRQRGVDSSSVREVKQQIEKKAKKFFGEPPF